MPDFCFQNGEREKPKYIILMHAIWRLPNLRPVRQFARFDGSPSSQCVFLPINGEKPVTTTPAPAPKQRSTGRTILTIFLVLIVLCVVCVVGVLVVAGPAVSNLINAATAPISASNDFMNAVMANDYAKAYGMIDPSQQSAYGGSAEGLNQTLTHTRLVPTKFASNNVLF